MKEAGLCGGGRDEVGSREMCWSYRYLMKVDGCVEDTRMWSQGKVMIGGCIKGKKMLMVEGCDNKRMWWR